MTLTYPSYGTNRRVDLLAITLVGTVLIERLLSSPEWTYGRWKSFVSVSRFLFCPTPYKGHLEPSPERNTNVTFFLDLPPIGVPTEKKI